MSRGNRKLAVLTLVGLAVSLGPVSMNVAHARTAMSYPAYHTVRSADSLKSIAHDFLTRAQDNRVTHVMTRHEMQQIKLLNKRKFRSHRRIEAGEKLLLAESQWEVPDGKPGWYSWYTGCSQGSLPASSHAPFDGWSLTARLAHPPIGKDGEQVVLTITNGGAVKRHVTVHTPRAQLTEPGSSRGGAVVSSDVVTLERIGLDPGESWHVREPVAAFRCGDTDVLESRLDRGHYDLYGALYWSTKHRGNVWVSAPADVRVTR